jgi:hypothetical protein
LLKSKITISGKYRTLSEITDIPTQTEIKNYLSKLLEQENIGILTGELEDFYIENPKFPKEAGVIETVSKLIENPSKKITDYFNEVEYITILRVFIKNCLNLEIL